MVLPQLHPRVRLAAQILQHAERRPVGQRGQHRARREVDADAHHLVGRDAGLGEEPRDCDLQALEVVTRMLQGPVGLELHVVVGGRKAGVDDAVGVRLDARPELATVGAGDEHGARRFGAEVDPERACHGWTTTFRPRRCNQVAERLRAFVEPVPCAHERRELQPPRLRQNDRAREVARTHPAAENERQLLAACRGRTEATAVSVGDADEHDATPRAHGRDRSVERPVSIRRVVGDVDP